ncbi:hypothetical protein [Brevundimonas sp.]|uniref:hypothetical protein n=1 Tax=Brevundimonas sp. TaxID=1871086 RepID=UPI003A95B2D4
MDTPKDKEDASAGLLNGTMITLIGGAFPALLTWSVVTDWHTWIAGDHTMTRTEATQGVTLLIVSLLMLRFGLRMLWLNGSALRRL